MTESAKDEYFGRGGSKSVQNQTAPVHRRFVTVNGGRRFSQSAGEGDSGGCWGGEDPWITGDSI